MINLDLENFILQLDDFFGLYTYGSWMFQILLTCAFICSILVLLERQDFWLNRPIILVRNFRSWSHTGQKINKLLYNSEIPVHCFLHLYLDIISSFWVPLHKWQLVNRKVRHPRIWELEAIFVIIFAPATRMLDFIRIKNSFLICKGNFSSLKSSILITGNNQFWLGW